MLIRSGLLLLFFSCVKSTAYRRGAYDVNIFDRYSMWPSVGNGVELLRKSREVQNAGNDGPNEGEDVKTLPSTSSSPAPSVTQNVTKDDSGAKNQSVQVAITEKPAQDVKQIPSNVTVPTTTVATSLTNATDTNTTSIKKPTIKQLDLNNPGVMKRGLIVFGGFSLLAIAYYIFYRRKGKNNDSNNTHSTNDANQFRYGVLQSEDKRDTELSRIPLTTESDDEEDEDLEIFDLQQKKKSLSYVNLQTNDEDTVFSLKDNEEDDGGNLLLDIEDGTYDTLINWSNNGSKSIL